MKFALVDGQRREAEPQLSGTCPLDGHPMVAKCGEERARHWAHKGNHSCDPWWENETEWHRNWKEHFPKEWQEKIHHAEDGERHIADVKTDKDWVIELQNSHIDPDERRSRDAFYKRVIWIVNGLRLKKDGPQFLKAWNAGAPISRNSNIRRVASAECALLRKWTDSPSSIFFDFGGGKIIWWVFHKNQTGQAYVTPLSNTDFIAAHRGGATPFDEWAKVVQDLATRCEENLRRGRII
jgi:hypothetical protein